MKYLIKHWALGLGKPKLSNLPLAVFVAALTICMYLVVGCIALKVIGFDDEVSFGFQLILGLVVAGAIEGASTVAGFFMAALKYNRGSSQ
jgi:hypothetical protein